MPVLDGSSIQRWHNGNSGIRREFGKLPQEAHKALCVCYEWLKLILEGVLPPGLETFRFGLVWLGAMLNRTTNYEEWKIEECEVTGGPFPSCSER
ncbi:hypothetical protein CEXT_360701 [Caerostris extrusa]|uniref:Uncharacterized protein n=1 Tax=Caerostris extrusa TaxID=172846 RepID=A0AAV4XHQ3_CAEEX|nr:hypothetical protein CEXT_360701 [Caerostris extrusa]